MRPRHNYLFSFALLLALIISPPKKPLSLPFDIGKELPFATIDRGGIGMSHYYWHSPGMHLLWDSEDVNKIDRWMPPQAREKLNQVDFSTSAIVAVFQGHFGEGGHEVIVEHYGIRGDTIVLIAQFWELGPDRTAPTVEVSRYHLVKIQKDSRLSSTSNVEMHSYICIYEE